MDVKTKQLFYGSREFRLTICNEKFNGEAGDTPQAVADYLQNAVKNSLFYRADRENFIVILLNTRRKILGFEVVATGILDAVMVHAREVFRPAIVGNAHAIILAHNHPGGDPSPSEADIRTTRDFVRTGQMLKIEVLDHIILGHPESGKGFSSLRELGHFY